MFVSKFIAAMGAGVSSGKGFGEPSSSEIANLGKPERRPHQELLVYVMPMGEELRKRSAICQLEVGTTGFRLLRPGTQDSLGMFPWGQIHSWAHTSFKFTFRFFDDNKRVVLLNTLCLRDVDVLLDHIKDIIDTILVARKTSAASDEEYSVLLKAMAGCREGGQLDLLLQALSKSFFWAKQGRELMELMPTNFDKVEAATQLHGRLVDQNRFSFLLEGLDCQEDSDNVWSRITMLKKQSGGKKSRSVSAAEPASAVSTISTRVIIPPALSDADLATQPIRRSEVAEAASGKGTAAVAPATEAAVSPPTSKPTAAISGSTLAATVSGAGIETPSEDAVARLSVPELKLSAELVEGPLSSLAI